MTSQLVLCVYTKTALNSGHSTTVGTERCYALRAQKQISDRRVFSAIFRKGHDVLEYKHFPSCIPSKSGDVTLVTNMDCVTFQARGAIHFYSIITEADSTINFSNCWSITESDHLLRALRCNTKSNTVFSQFLFLYVAWKSFPCHV